MASAEKKQTYRVVLDNIAKSGPMGIADAHNYAVELQAHGPVEVVETYEWFCMKCGDEYWTQYKPEMENVKQHPRWRCDSCVWGWL